LTSTPVPETLADIRDVRILQETSQGTLFLVPRCPVEVFPRLELEKGIGNFPQYSSIIQKIEVFQGVASKKDGRVGLVVLGERSIVAYLACWYPSPDDRWSRLGELMYEMGVLEVSRNFRNMGIGVRIFLTIMADDFFEDKIAYVNGFSWHWDLDGSGLTMAQYRVMMINLVRKAQFEEVYTNEPNIALRQENVFLARIGSRVSEQDRARFRDLRFNIVRR